MAKSVDSLLESIYYAKKSNEPGGFMSVNGLYHVAKLKNPDLKYKDVVEWLNKQKVYLERKELPKTAKIKGHSQRYFHVNRPKKELVIDTAYLQRYKTPWKYMIIGVDALSSRLYTGFLHKLSAEGAAKIVEKWVKNEPKWKIVYTDNGIVFYHLKKISLYFFTGSEFKSVKFNDMLRKYDIKHLYSSTMFTNKTSLAEIYIRKFRETLAKVLASGKSKNKLNAYKVTTEIINSNPKISLGMLTPAEAEKLPGDALFNKQYVRWKKQDKFGLPKSPRFKEKEKV